MLAWFGVGKVRLLPCSERKGLTQLKPAFVFLTSRCGGLSFYFISPCLPSKKKIVQQWGDVIEKRVGTS
jgi:hypothetical protein